MKGFADSQILFYNKNKRVHTMFTFKADCFKIEENFVYKLTLHSLTIEKPLTKSKKTNFVQ